MKMLALHVHSSRPSSGSSSRSTQRPTSAQTSNLCIVMQMILHATAATAEARNSMTLDLNSRDTKGNRSVISSRLHSKLTATELEAHH